MFYIVEMTVTEGKDKDKKFVAVVPNNWFEPEGICYWPPSRDVTKLVKERRPSTSSWKSYPARILHAYGTFEEARTNLFRYEEESDPNTDVEMDLQKRTSKVPSRFLETPSPLPSTKSKSSTLPNPPNFPFILAPTTLFPDEAANGPEDSSVSTFGRLERLPEMDFALAGNVDTAQLNNLTAPDLTFTEHEFIKTGQRNFVYTQVADADTQTPGVSPDLTLKILETLEALVDDVKQLKSDLRNMDRKLDQIKSKTTDSAQFQRQRKILEKKLSTLAEFQEFDKSLEESQERTTGFKQNIIQYGGDSSADCVNRIFREIFTNQLAKSFSLKGLQGNQNFSVSVMMPIILDVIRSHKLPNVTDKQIEHSIGEWFRHAGDRIKQEQKTRVGRTEPNP